MTFWEHLPQRLDDDSGRCFQERSTRSAIQFLKDVAVLITSIVVVEADHTTSIQRLPAQKRHVDTWAKPLRMMKLQPVEIDVVF